MDEVDEVDEVFENRRAKVVPETPPFVKFVGDLAPRSTSPPAMAASSAEPIPIEGIIFDLDGTLIDYEGASHIALANPLERRGKALSWELHASIVGTKPEDWSRKILESCGLTDKVTPAEYAAEYFQEVDSLYSSIPPWPGTIALLRALRAAGFPMAIATSSPRASFETRSW